MTNNRVILHSDMNSFYASVEMMLEPKLRGKAVAVCGSTEDRHGIILAKSELAKKAGVKTGMVNWEARCHCKDLILVPPQYDQYLKYSKLAREIYSQYTDCVEPFGMDECWLDCTGSGIFGDGRQIAETIRHRIREELGLTVSIGVSFNKIFAKLGSDMKKPDAVTEITADNFRKKVWPLDVSELLYVGKATEKKLKSKGVRTIGELAQTKPEYLKTWLGINGLKLWIYASGEDMSRVMPIDFVSPVKSIGHGVTCTSDLYTEEEVHKVLMELAQDVGHRLRIHNLAATGVQIGVRRSDLSGNQYQCQLPLKTQLPSELTQVGIQLFRKHFYWDGPIRSLTIRAIDLIPQNEEEQLSFYVNNERRFQRQKLEASIEDIRRRFGPKSLTYAFLMGDLKIPQDGRETVKMPGLMYS